MPDHPEAPQSEELFAHWLRESDPELAHEKLERLILLHARPVVQRIISFKLRGGIDVDDVCHNALANLISHLARLKLRVDHTPIQNFLHYTAATAFNACKEYFRKSSPERQRLERKVRYLITHSPSFALWETGDGTEVCGIAAMKGQHTSASAEPSRCPLVGGDLRGATVADLVFSALQTTETPLKFEHLVEIVAEQLGLREAQIHWREDDGREGVASEWEELPDTQPSVEKRLAQRRYLEQLWLEICELPLHQRAALLLNLRDSAGGSIQLFDWLGVATVQQIAAALEMQPERFAEMWKELPFDDARIAREFGISRQDVINRRSSARKRLAQRMTDFESSS